MLQCRCPYLSKPTDGRHALVCSRCPSPHRLSPAGQLLLDLDAYFESDRQPLQQPFRDAGYARADFHLSIQDVIMGVRKAIEQRLLRLDEFDVKEYESYEKVENGDWNFLTPHFLAFASPVEPLYHTNFLSAPPAAISTSTSRVGTPEGGKSTGMTPKLPKAFRLVLDQFEKKNVRLVIRSAVPLPLLSSGEKLLTRSSGEQVKQEALRRRSFHRKGNGA